MEEDRIKNLERRLIEYQRQVDSLKKKKEFQPSWNVKRIIKTGNKKPETVVVQYLTRDYQIRWQTCRIISGNLIVVNNKVHVLNPKKIFRWGKFNCYIIREIDRQPVSNDDIDEVIARRADTEADVPLIKAVLGAIQKPSPIQGKTIWIILGIIALVVAIGAIFFIKGG